jgi:hypothetical protein
MVTELDGDQKSERPLQEMSGRQMIMRIMELATTEDLPDEALEKMIESLAQIVSQYAGKHKK